MLALLALLLLPERSQEMKVSALKSFNGGALIEQLKICWFLTVCFWRVPTFPIELASVELKRGADSSDGRNSSVVSVTRGRQILGITRVVVIAGAQPGNKRFPP